MHALPPFRRRTLAFLALLAAVMILVNATGLAFTPRYLARATGGATLLDLHFHDATRDVWNALAAYGARGRRICLAFYATWDLALPAAAFGFGWCALEDLWDSPLPRLAPVAALAADLGENLLIAVLLVRFPRFPRPVAATAGWVTTLKWMAYGTTLLLVLAGAVRRRGDGK